MPASQWRHTTHLIQRLADRPQQFQFYQALRLIELWLQRDDRGRGNTLEQALRSENSVSLRFPCSQIENLTFDSPSPTPDHVRANNSSHHIRITPAFMGLLGVHGVLPYIYTNAIATQIHVDKNRGGRAFFDIFTHRSVILFYRAWEKCHLEFRHDGNGDEFLRQQIALSGVKQGTKKAGQYRLPDEFLAHYAALLRHRPVSGAALVRVLREYFNQPFELDALVGAWIDHPRQLQIQLGVTNNALGRDTLLGPRYRRRDLRAHIRIGPLSRADAQPFLEHGSGYQALRAVLALFAPPHLRIEVRVILRAQDVPQAKLDGHSVLGRDAFLLHAPALTDRGDIHYHLIF